MELGDYLIAAQLIQERKEEDLGKIDGKPLKKRAGVARPGN